MTTIDELTPETLIDNFHFLDDWESRFDYLLDLGQAVPRLEESDLVEANRVDGCVSQVWLKSTIVEDDPPRFEFVANSDAHMVNGLIAVLMVVYNGRTPREAAATDATEMLREMDLETHLSPMRRNGLHAMIQRIRSGANQAERDAAG